MNPRAVPVDDWPQPDTVNAAVVTVGPSKLVICYGTGEGAFAVVAFPDWSDLKAGGPNDEALHGHSLYAFGLKHYSIHRIENSPWLNELDRQNSVHARHNSARFRKDKVHYLFALKEETIECMVSESAGVNARIEVFDSRRGALRHIKDCIDA